MKRIVSVWLPDLALDRLRRDLSRQNTGNTEQPWDEALPCVLVGKADNGIRIMVANGPAHDSGIRAGMPLTDARTLEPSVTVRPAEPQKDAAALRFLAEWCERYTPQANVDDETGLWLDITGAAHLLGGEACLLEDLGTRLSALGFANRIGLTGTLGAAWAVARFAPAGDLKQRIVPPGSERAALCELPVEALRLEDTSLHLLKRFGFKRIGQLHDLPRTSLKRRFPSSEASQAVLKRLDQACGLATEQLAPLNRPPAHIARLSFPEPVLETASFHLILEQLLQRLCGDLEKHHKGARVFIFTTYRADGGQSRIAVGTARPSRDPAHLARLFRDRLETIDPGFGVDVLTLAADRAEDLAPGQLELSRRAENISEDNDIHRLVDRLVNRLGAKNVHRIMACESHIPEQAESPISAIRPGESQGRIPVGKTLRPLRLLTRPEPVQVLAEVPEGPPVRFTWRRITHRIVRVEGAERIAPEWWHIGAGHGQRTRDYYRVEDADGRRFWLFREGLYQDEDDENLPAWHIHGLFA